MTQHVIRWTALWGLMLGILLGGTSRGAQAADLPGILGQRQWFLAEEFDKLPDLRARPHHTVILHLAPQTKGGKLIRKTIPYLFPETATFNFCVPKEDAHLRALELVQERSQKTVVRVHRGAPCQTETIPVGLYQLHIDYDGKDVPAEGRKAFVHVPRLHLAGGLKTTGGNSLLQATTGGFLNSLPFCPGSISDSFYSSVNNPLFTLTVDGFYVGAAHQPASSTAAYDVLTYSTAQNSLNAWSLCRFGTVNYFLNFFNSVDPAHIRTWYLGITSLGGYGALDFPSTICAPSVCGFLAYDLGKEQFTLAWSDGGAPLYATAGRLMRGTTTTTPSVFTVLYKTYRQGAQVPAPQTGEVHLLNAGAACSQAPAATYVSSNYLPDLNTAGIKGFTFVLVRPGPKTAAVAYPSLNRTGTPQYITQETCLSSLPASLAIVPTDRDFVASTNSCIGCDLSGVDLSGLNLTGGDFTATVFNHADLTNTNFQSALLDHAKFRSYDSECSTVPCFDTTLDGTDFLGAHLNCTDFQNSDLRAAFFWYAPPPPTPPILPVITRDFSCRVALQYARLSRTTFPLADWHYLLLDAAVITDASGQTISTTSAPLDLSRARLSRTTGLTHVGLAGAILDGADFTGTDLTGANLQAVTATIPATFNSATLTQASLGCARDSTGKFIKDSNGQNVCTRLSGSFFRGAQMSPVNLGGADLSDALLEDDGSGQFGHVNLAGSYMGDTKLNGAHLTDAVLDKVSWYNVNAATPIATGAGAVLTGASFNLADLPGLDLTGAHLQGADLTNTQLIGANLTNADLEPDFGTKPCDSNGHPSNLSTANLRGANLSETNFCYANLFNAGVDAASEQTVYIEVLKDPDRYQNPQQYQYFAVSRPATVLSGATITDHAICPNGALGPCGAITDPKWVAPSPPQEPSDCKPSEYDSGGNVIAITCTSSRHPAQ